MEPSTTIPLPPPTGGVHRNDEAAGQTQLVDAENVLTAGGALRRRPGLRTFAHAPLLTLPEGQTQLVALDAAGTATNFADRTGAIFDLSAVYLVVVAAEPFAAIDWRQVNDAGPESYAAHAWLRADYWDGTAWQPIPFVLDCTRDISDEGEYLHPLARDGVIAWHVNQLDGWATRTVGAATGYAVRLWKADVTGTRVELGSGDYRIEAPGVRAALLAPVNGLIATTVGDGRRTLLVGGDRPTPRGLEDGAQLGLATKAYVETLHLRMDEGGGIVDLFTWPRWRYSDTRTAYTEEAATASPTIGATRQLRKGRQDYSWNARQWAGANLRAGIAPVGTLAVGSLVCSIGETEDHALEHAWLLCTTSGGVPSGEYVQVRDSTYDSGTGRTTLLVYPAFSVAPTSAARFALYAPPRFVRAVEYPGREWPVRENAEHTLTLETEATRPYGTHFADVVAGPEFTWEVGAPLRWVLGSGRRWCAAVDPGTQSVILTNGAGAMLTWDGERLRTLTADYTSTNAQDLVALIPSSEAVAGTNGLISSALALLSAPPEGAYVTVWKGRIFVAGLPHSPRSVRYSEGGPDGAYNNIWPRVNLRTMHDEVSQAVTGFVQIQGRLFVFSPTAITEIVLVPAGDREALALVPRVTGEGFTAQNAVTVVSTPNGGEVAVGVTGRGVSQFDGNSLLPIVEDWGDVLDEGVIQGALGDALATTLRISNAVLVVVQERGDSEARTGLWIDLASGAVWPQRFAWGVTALATERTEDGREVLLVGYSDGLIATFCEQTTDDGETVTGRARWAPFRPFTTHEAVLSAVVVTALEGGSAQALTVAAYIDRSRVAAASRSVVIAKPAIEDRERSPTWGDPSVYWTTPDALDADGLAARFSPAEKPTARLEMPPGTAGHMVQVEVRGSWCWRLHSVELLCNMRGIHGRRA